MWKSVSCAVRGSGHEAGGIPCQDKTFELYENGVHVIALADGAGSARLSHFGAARAAETAARFTAEHFQEWMLCENGQAVKLSLMQRLSEVLSEEAKARECGLSDLASTLLLGAVSGDNFILAHIGDGVIGYLDGGQLKVASVPENGEFSNETTFVTSQNALRSLRIFKGRLGEKDAFVLMSDGTEQSLYHKQTKTLADVTAKLMHRTALLDEALMREQLSKAFREVITKRTQDDCSIAILARTSSVLQPVTEMSMEARKRLYRIPDDGRNAEKRLARMDQLLLFTEEARTLRELAEKLHLKPAYAAKYAERLTVLGLLKKENGRYRRS